MEKPEKQTQEHVIWSKWERPEGPEGRPVKVDGVKEGCDVDDLTKHIKTQVLVENGGTVVIGGIFELTENETITKVPVLGDIPIAGNLFKNSQKNTSKQEMLVFITPKMIADRAAVR